MSEKEQLKKEIDKLSDHRAREILDYVRFLVKQESETMTSTIVSEPSLAREWLTSEEDEAWKDL
ncbi:MAG: DUF2281 domain-containing protein [Balneolales bacterium]|nr:DUF2281 domain-containing protein [Balneolales bacterium]